VVGSVCRNVYSAEQTVVGRGRKAAGAVTEPTAGNSCDTFLRKWFAPEGIPENGGAPAESAPNLRRLLYAGQFRLRAMPVPGTDEKVEVRTVMAGVPPA